MNRAKAIPKKTCRYQKEKDLSSILKEKLETPEQLDDFETISHFINDFYKIKVWKRVIDVTGRVKLSNRSSKNAYNLSPFLIPCRFISSYPEKPTCHPNRYRYQQICSFVGNLLKNERHSTVIGCYGKKSYCIVDHFIADVFTKW